MAARTLWRVSLAAGCRSPRCRRQAVMRLPGKFRAPTNIRSGTQTATATSPQVPSALCRETVTRWNRWRPTFGQDLNSDGTIGLTTTVIQTDGSTSLTGVANEYFLDNSGGSDPALQYHGSDVAAGEFGAWVPIGAVQTASGYDVAWEIPGANEYTVWSTDSNGNYISDTHRRCVGKQLCVGIVRAHFRPGPERRRSDRSTHGDPD